MAGKAAVLRRVKLSDCASFQEGYVNPPQGVPEYFGDEVKWLRAVDLNNSFVWETSRRLSRAGFESAGKASLLFEPDTLAISKSGTIGRLGILKDYMCGNRAVINIKVDRATFDNRFIFYSLQIRRNEIEELATGSVQRNLYCSVLGDLQIDVPPLAEQKAIAAVLGALDDKIELNRRMNATLEAMARALFQSWFVDFDPVRAKLDGRPPAALDPATAALFPEHLEDSPLGKKPVGWEVTVLENVLAVLETGGRPKGGVGGITSGVPSIGAESIVSVGVFDFGKTKFVPVEFHEGMRKGHIQSHDVLLYKDGGRPGEYEPHVSMFGDGFPFEKCSINEHVYRLRTNERLSQEYLYFWMTSEFALAEMRIKGTGVAIPGLNSTAVRSLGVLIPPPPIVKAFTKQAAPLVTRILANAKQSRTLATLRDTLLPKLLSGEISPIKL
jgi:type I restriction enzyme, S subunit